MPETATSLTPGAPSKDIPVDHPTWLHDIRHMFSPVDKAHMKSVMGLDLSNYKEVRGLSGDIYGQVAMGKMPPSDPWPEAWVETYLNWMKAGYPKGVPATMSPVSEAEFAAGTKPERMRKDAATLTDAEIEKVIRAFDRMMTLDPSEPNSYFVQAGLHWFPAPLYCQHHVPGYNPWHRAYLLSFENAMRSIPGCEDVTLPYWDITKPIPDFLQEGPLKAYTLQADAGPGFKKGYTTERYAIDEIYHNIFNKYKIPSKIHTALSALSWETFHGIFADAPNNAIISAHDSGHNSIGTTMANQEVAAFDPIFWFFHCNWDRLFWKWQNELQATSLDGLMSTIEDDEISRQYFTVPALMDIQPFTDGEPGVNTVDIIDSAGSLGIGYLHPPEELLIARRPALRDTVTFGTAFNAVVDRVRVRVSGVNRLVIPGSFDVHFMVDDEIVETSSMFQPVEASTCPNCSKNALVHFDFEVPIDLIAKGKLSARVEPHNKDIIGDFVPSKLMGNPSIQISIPLADE